MNIVVVQDSLIYLIGGPEQRNPICKRSEVRSNKLNWPKSVFNSVSYTNPLGLMHLLSIHLIQRT